MSWRNGTDQPRGTGQLPGHCPVIQDTPEDTDQLTGGHIININININISINIKLFRSIKGEIKQIAKIQGTLNTKLTVYTECNPCNEPKNNSLKSKRVGLLNN